MLPRERGFTLTELIIVIVIMGVVALISVQFVSLSTRGAIDTSARQRMAQAAAVINEQISRHIRNALPNSVREIDAGDCIEWIPVEAASVYRSVPIGSPAGSFEAVAYSDSTSVSGYIAVYPIAGDPFDLTDPGVLSTSAGASVPAGSGLVTVDLDGDHQFVADSPTRRFYVVGSPRAFCQGEGADSPFLFSYRGYGFEPDAGSVRAGLPSTVAGGREVVGARLVPGSLVFDYEGPTQTRNAVVAFQYQLTDTGTGETLAVSQEVQIRNVP